MRIWLIRHTSVALGLGYCYGRTDVELANTFEEEAQVIKAKLGPLSPDAKIITSPAKRCQRLATEIGAGVTLDADLWELNFGAWEGLRWDEVPRLELDEWAGDLGNISPPGGETLTELATRVVRSWQRMLTLSTDTVYCVTHAGVIRVLLSRLFEMPIGKAFSLQVDYGGCSLLQVTGDQAQLKKFNL